MEPVHIPALPIELRTKNRTRIKPTHFVEIMVNRRWDSSQQVQSPWNPIYQKKRTSIGSAFCGLETIAFVVCREKPKVEKLSFLDWLLKSVPRIWPGETWTSEAGNMGVKDPNKNDFFELYQ